MGDRMKRILLMMAIVTATTAAFADVNAVGGGSLTAATQEMITRRHIPLADLAEYHVVSFPEVVVVTRSVPDAGIYFVAGYVGQRWIIPDRRDKNGVVFAQLTQSVLSGRRWRSLSMRQRLDLVRRWMLADRFCSDHVRLDDFAHALTVRADRSDVVVSAWIDRERESRGGRREFSASAPSIFRIAPDGATTVQEPDAVGANWPCGVTEASDL